MLAISSYVELLFLKASDNVQKPINSELLS